MKKICEDVWHIEVFINVEDLYLLEFDAFLDMVFMKAEVLYSLCYEGFWPIHAGVVVVVEFGWKEIGHDKYVVSYWCINSYLRPLHHSNWGWCGVGGLIYIWYPPHTTKDNKAYNWAVLENFLVRTLFCCALELYLELKKSAFVDGKSFVVSLWPRIFGWISRWTGTDPTGI